MDVARSIDPAVTSWLYPFFGFLPMDDASKRGKDDLINKWLPPVENHLKKRSWFVGDRVTLADTVFFGAMFQAMKYGMDPEIRKKFPAITEWFDRCLSEVNFKKVYKEFNYCNAPRIDMIRR
eukprot:TRINITY_DN3904_c0_g1_i2.p1 TRINITY_DN3904_c0_g1~~TRINITY_DN3904_c0_g1_i2.p1  ORF type:complete len:122 (+),score=24.70 TRINITY_DN3904_c0_g1_i2:327-692(+)